jgi:glutathione synthase/RimK-type ligase-like ATP-grasp enzyme
MKNLRVLVAGQPHGTFLKEVKALGALRGIEVDGCWADALVSVQDQSGTTLTVNGKNLFDYDLIHLFTVQKNWLLWFAAVAEAAKHGVKIIDENCLDASLFQHSVLARFARQTEFSIPYPATTIVSSFRQAMIVLRSCERPIVVKILNSRQGRGVALIKNWFDFLVFFVRHRKNQSFAFRKFIKADGDYRITVIGGKAYGACLRRAQKGEWRNNLSLGGIGTNVVLSEIPDLVALAEKVVKLFHIDIAGVDVIVSEDGTPYILEINKSPQLEVFEQEESSGVNLFEKVIELYLERCERPSR